VSVERKDFSAVHLSASAIKSICDASQHVKPRTQLVNHKTPNSQGESKMNMIEISNENGHVEGVRFDLSYLECETMLAQAGTLIQEHQIQESVELLFKILQYNPQFGKAYNHLGWVYEIEYKDYARAEEYYKRAMQYSPEYGVSYTHYARLLSNCKRFDELKAHLDLALTIPTVADEEICFEYALMYEMQQNPEAAINYYIKAAMSTLRADRIPSCQEAVTRCKTKLELKKLLSDL
jgi:tetratricopeptide (TPR) repeat protein